MGLTGFLLAAAIAVFHGQLLWQRLSDGSLLQPIVVARWALSALLILALLQLWSRGLPLLRGRRAGVLWLVIFLLHAMAPGGSVPAVGPTAASLLPAMLALLVVIAFGLAAVPGADSSVPPPPTRRRRRRPHPAAAGWCRDLFSRPPPAPLHS